MTDFTASLEWEPSVPHPDGQGGYVTMAPITTPLPFDRPGGICRLNRETWLLSGYDSGTGTGQVVRVLLVRTTPRVMVVIDQLPLPGVDPIDIAWNAHEGRAYVRYHLANTLVAFDLPNALAPLPPASALSPSIDGSVLPALQATARYRFWPRSRPEAGVVFAPTDPQHWFGTVAQPRFNAAYSSGSGWTV
ncbi:MAG: hypothetical protein JNK78_11765, partial [Planctomycetes bacterium]|nr:hypothetical protein [Planctomycetota bacterium]